MKHRDAGQPLEVIEGAPVAGAIPAELEAVPRDAVVPGWISPDLVSKAAIAREVMARLEPCIDVCEQVGMEASAAYMRRSRALCHAVVATADRFQPPGRERAPEPA